MRILTVTLLIFLPLLSKAQDSLENTQVSPGSIVKFSPLHLLNFYPTFQLSYEHRIAGPFTMQVEGGWVFNTHNYNEDYQNKRGYKLKLESRFYHAVSTERELFFYLALEGHYNRIKFDRAAIVRECFDNSCTHEFMRETTTLVRYREHGATMKWGFMKTVYRFVFDLSTGWTVRNIWYSSDGSRFDDVFIDFGPNETDRITISPYVGIRFGYRFK